MKTRLLIIIVSIIILSSIFFVIIWNETNTNQECNEECEIERRRIHSGNQDGVLITTMWISLPVTSCGYPWHGAYSDKTEQYFDEYRQTVENYDGSFWLDADRAVQHVITQYYEDLGMYVHDVKTHHDETMERTGEGCNTTTGGVWFLQISYSDLDYFLNDGFEPVEFADVQSTESKILQCYALFHCDVENKNFKECIGAKKDGNTINNICSNSNITIDDGCATIVFPDSTKTVSCHYEAGK